jgi:hypothetical protein
MKLFITLLGLIIGTLGVFPDYVHARKPIWEITLKEHKDFRLGKYGGAIGATAPEGVRFVVKNVHIKQPIQVTLESKSEKNNVTLSVFKDNWDSPNLESSTGKKGITTLRFRTGGNVRMKVSGPHGAQYQMLVWVGPKFEIKKPAPFMSMKEYEEQASLQSRTQPADMDTRHPPSDKKDRTLYILLILLIIILAVIAFLLYRGQKKQNMNIFILGFIFLGIMMSSQFVFAYDDPLKPRPLTMEEIWEKNRKAINELREKLDMIPETGKSEIDDLVTGTKLMFTFMEYFGLIDRREAAVQPNYNPDGMPPLPSRCYADPHGKCAACFDEATEKLNKWHKLLEDQWVIYRQTMLEAGRIIELSDAALSLLS